MEKKVLILKELVLHNFKKVKDQKINFTDKTYITSENGVGKTTIYDALTWLLFGKDSSGRTKFEIRFTDENGNVERKKESYVSGIINDIQLKRVQREKWQTKKGEENEEYIGNETIYEIDGIIKKEGEYKSFVSSLIDENVFKMLTSITHFAEMKWEDRRKMLYTLVDNVSNLDIAKENEDFTKLIKYIGNKPFEEFCSDLKKKIAPMKKEVDLLNAEIEGTQKNISEDIDIKPLLIEKEKLGNPNSINDEIIKKRAAIEQEIQNKISERNKVIQDNKQSKANQDSVIEEKKKRISQLQILIKDCELKREELLKEFAAEKEKQFSAKSCPNCGIDVMRVLSILQECIDRHEETEGTSNEDLIKLHQELSEKDTFSQQYFNNQKAEKLNEINSRGGSNNIQKQNFEKELKEIEDFLSKVEIITVDETPFDDTELRKTMPELLTNNEDAFKRISEIDVIIGRQEEITTQKTKLQDSIERHKKMTSDLAALQRTEFICDKFTRAKSDILVDKINNIFKYAKFKMFDIQVNGSEVPCCDIIVNGIPYNTNLNTGAKINAGIDIINVFSDIYKVKCPLFLDNMESCTDPIDSDTQSIYLIAKKGVKQLLIENL